uniref:Uncharacterized protein n=1 Tax=Rhizophora mucronata TaxID=61149 RepID=A0A2P2N8D7_RHIMU
MSLPLMQCHTYLFHSLSNTLQSTWHVIRIQDILTLRKSKC